MLLCMLTDVEIEGVLLSALHEECKRPLLFPADAITLSSTCSFFSLLCSDILEGKKELQ